MGKKAVIFGATSGIGKALALVLVKDGYTVAVTGRRAEKLAELKTMHPKRIITKQHDVTKLGTNAKVLQELQLEMQSIDLIVYSSGVVEPNYELDWNKEQPTLDVNVIAATHIFGLSYQLFKKQGFGHLVGISSVAGVRGNRHVPAYFASKAYQNNYLESLWMKGQRSQSKIYVTDIAPGFVDTKMALGNTFGKAPVEKAAFQIYKAITSKKKKAYITKRWYFVANLMRILPARLVMKFA